MYLDYYPCNSTRTRQSEARRIMEMVTCLITGVPDLPFLAKIRLSGILLVIGEAVGHRVLPVIPGETYLELADRVHEGESITETITTKLSFRGTQKWEVEFDDTDIGKVEGLTADGQQVSLVPGSAPLLIVWSSEVTPLASPPKRSWWQELRGIVKEIRRLASTPSEQGS